MTIFITSCGASATHEKASDPTPYLAEFTPDDQASLDDLEAILLGIWKKIPPENRLEGLMGVFESSSPLSTTAMTVAALGDPLGAVRRARACLGDESFHGHPAALAALLLYGSHDLQEAVKTGLEALSDERRHSRLAGHLLLQMVTLWPVGPHPQVAPPTSEIPTETIESWNRLGTRRWDDAEVLREGIRLHPAETTISDADERWGHADLLSKRLQIIFSSNAPPNVDRMEALRLHKSTAEDDGDRRLALVPLHAVLDFSKLKSLWRLSRFI